LRSIEEKRREKEACPFKTRSISFAVHLPGVSHALTLRARLARMLRKARDETADMSDKRETSSALRTRFPARNERASGSNNGIAPGQQSARVVFTNFAKCPDYYVGFRMTETESLVGVTRGLFTRGIYRD